MICRSFLLFVGYGFILLIMSFETQSCKMEDQFVYFFFSCALGVKNPLLTSLSWRFIPGFSSKRFVGFVLTLRCSSIWSMWCKVWGSTFILSPVALQLSQKLLLKTLFFPHWIGIVVSSRWAMDVCIWSLSSIPVCMPLCWYRSVLILTALGGILKLGSVSLLG